MNILQKMIYVKRLHHQFYNWNRAKLENHQKKRLDKIFAFVKKNSVYYQKILRDKKAFSHTNVPIMTKEEMMRNFNQINTSGLDRDELIDFYIKQEKKKDYSKYQNEYSIGLSSGTSGNKALTILSRKEINLYNCLLFSRNGIPRQIKPKKVLFALRRYNPTFMEVSSFGVHLVYIDYTLTAKNMIDLINSKHLNILAGPPSLLEIIEKHNDEINHNIEAVISYAEVLADSVKRKLEDTFGAHIVQIYQGAEGFIASTCKEGNLHLNEDTIFFEFIDQGDSLGKAKNLVLTDLYRTTQPILRYQMNDILEISYEPCVCGSSFRVVSKIHGRADDIFHLKDDNGKIKFLFPDYVRRSINQASDEIAEYQAIQKSFDCIEIRLIIIDESKQKEIEEKIVSNLMKWASKLQANLGEVEFSTKSPEKNPISKKLIRVQRRF